MEIKLVLISKIHQYKILASKFWIIFFLLILSTSCIKQPAQTICTTIPNNTPYYSRLPYLFEYFVNGKTYMSYGVQDQFTVAGEKFKIVYDSLYPKRAHVLNEEPLFLTNEQVVKTTGTILKASNRECKFEYHSKASQKPHKKIQMYYKGTRKKYHLKKGMKFEVEYSPYNAQRAIIYFDRPAK